MKNFLTSITVFLIMLCFCSCNFIKKSNNAVSTSDDSITTQDATPSISSEYNALQKFFLISSDNLTEEDLKNYCIENNLCFASHISYDNKTIYDISYDLDNSSYDYLKVYFIVHNSEYIVENIQYHLSKQNSTVYSYLVHIFKGNNYYNNKFPKDVEFLAYKIEHKDNDNFVSFNTAQEALDIVLSD